MPRWRIEWGAHIRALIRVLAAAVALAMSTGTAFAVMGKTNTDVALRTAPAAQAELILNLSEGTLVNVGRCSRGWCGVTWNKYGGYVRAERTPIPEHSGRWSTRNSRLSPLSL